jgi:hypothetical protein
MKLRFLLALLLLSQATLFVAQMVSETLLSDGSIITDKMETCTVQYVVPSTDTKTAISSTRIIAGWQDKNTTKNFIKTELRHDLKGYPYFLEIIEPYVLAEKVPANITQRLATKDMPCLVETITTKDGSTEIIKTFAPEYEAIAVLK